MADSSTPDWRPPEKSDYWRWLSLEPREQSPKKKFESLMSSHNFVDGRKKKTKTLLGLLDAKKDSIKPEKKSVSKERINLNRKRSAGRKVKVIKAKLQVSVSNQLQPNQ